MKFKNFKNCGYYLMIDFTSASRQWIVGGDVNKRIYHYQNGALVNVETYNPVKVQNYQRNGIIVIDRTRGRTLPRDATDLPVQEQSLGIIELPRRLG